MQDNVKMFRLQLRFKIRYYYHLFYPADPSSESVLPWLRGRTAIPLSQIVQPTAKQNRIHSDISPECIVYPPAFFRQIK